MKVSWQVTGIRQDHWANADQSKVEEGKPSHERGYYIHPELHDNSSDKSVGYIRYKDQNDIDLHTIKNIKRNRTKIKGYAGKITCI